MKKLWVLFLVLAMVCLAMPASAQYAYKGYPLQLCSDSTGDPRPCRWLQFLTGNSAGMGTLDLLPTGAAMYRWNDAGRFVRWNGASGSATVPGYTRLMDGDTTALGDIELMDGSVEVATTLGILGRFQMLVWNGTGSAPAATGAAAVSTSTLRVVKATDSAVVLSLQIIDDWDESDRAKVNPIAGQAGIAAGSGAVDVLTPRVILATDDPAVVSLAIIDDWDATEDAAVPADGAAVMVEASSSQKVAVDTGDATIPSANLNGEIVIAGHTWGTTSNRGDEIDPVSAHHVEDTLADVTDETSGTTTYYYIDLDGFTGMALQVEIGSATDTITYTVECTIQDDGTAPGSTVYQDVTQYGMNIESAASTAADYTADAILTLPSRSNYKYCRVKTVSSGGNNTGDYVIFMKKWFGS
jgi:hypothetical protein